MTEKKFFFLDSVWQQFSLDSAENWLRWNSWNSKNLFFLYMQLEKASLIKHCFSDPEKTNIYLAERLKLTLIMFLKYKHSTFAWTSAFS